MVHNLEIGDEKPSQRVLSFNGQLFRYHEVNVEKDISLCWEQMRKNI